MKVELDKYDQERIVNMVVAQVSKDIYAKAQNNILQFEHELKSYIRDEIKAQLANPKPIQVNKV